MAKLNTTGAWLNSATPPTDPQADFITPSSLPNVRLLTADFELSDIEDNQIQRWLLQDRTNGDVRSRLVRHLRAIRNKPDCDFDYIIMDAPPRLSLAAANAVRASSMILIPTRLQYLASQPIAKMLNRLVEFKSRSGGQFKIGGVICNFAADRSRFTAKEQPFVETIREAVDTHPDTPRIFNTLVPDTPYIGASDARPAYLSDSKGPNSPRPIFDQLTDEILQRLTELSAGR
ncbi:ParA family protein [Hyphomonas sp.]|uniref:ParA family protein n=1 Tax=Hyphomonas sp. TaxID=87 RepID=UPI00391CC7E9